MVSEEHGERKEKLMIPSIAHYLLNMVAMCMCSCASGIRLLVLTDHVSAYRNIRMISEVCYTFCSNSVKCRTGLIALHSADGEWPKTYEMISQWNEILQNANDILKLREIAFVNCWMQKKNSLSQQYVLNMKSHLGFCGRSNVKVYLITYIYIQHNSYREEKSSKYICIKIHI